MSMKSEALDHWNKIACGSRREKPGMATCSYCLRFIEDNCKGCPIYLATGRIFCRATSYPTIACHRINQPLYSHTPWQAGVAEEIEEMIELIESLPEDE